MRQTKDYLTAQSENFSHWYNEVVLKAELAERSAVRGCMVIKPYGYALWENFQRILDQKIKDTGHSNVYFPLFIPKSFFGKEAEHVKGFAKECAVVTHYRLKESPEGIIVDPAARLEEELVIRPTSETIMYSTFSKWIESWRDLPLLLNQWANIVRWEMRTRLFLRTTEFLWQEGHTAHATEAGAEEEALKMLGVYKDFAENFLALSVFSGKKSEAERFAGALRTYTVEVMMRDGKALQAGTSHNLGQGFAKAFDIKFADKDGKLQHVWQTSWGASTRLVGALIMAHGDDKGLIIPPKVAPIQVVIVPIFSGASSDSEVERRALELKRQLGEVFRVEADLDKETTPGFKFNKWELKGVPLRFEIGPQELETEQVVVVRRDKEGKEPISWSQLDKFIESVLGEIQGNLLKRHQDFSQKHTEEATTYREFKEMIKSEGFVKSFWCEDRGCEEKIKEETGASTRCLPLSAEEERGGKCVFCGNDAPYQWVFAQAY